jgi:hypothetical protein
VIARRELLDRRPLTRQEQHRVLAEVEHGVVVHGDVVVGAPGRLGVLRRDLLAVDDEHSAIAGGQVGADL